ncbi:MAG TPA: DUF790 family protein, partial [Polyangium sp.]|nr:DUF790 family protein [Polyangium sp.]
MLTTELLRVRKRNGILHLQYLQGKVIDEIKPMAADFIDVLTHSAGDSREDIESALESVPVPVTLRLVGAGLRKL